MSDSDIHRDFHLTSPLTKGPDVKALQNRLNGIAKDLPNLTDYHLDEDGAFGRHTLNATHRAAFLEGLTDSRLEEIAKERVVAQEVQENLRHPDQLSKAQSERAQKRREEARKRQERFEPLEGVDFSAGNPSASAFKSAGKHFVCRYLSHDPAKNLTPNEAEKWSQAGIKIVVVWETSAQRALEGHNAGVEDAKVADSQLRGCGGAGHPIYFAADWDVTTAQKPAVIAYLKGAASVLGKGRVGLYGGYWAVKAAADAEACKYFWQTYAWSGGNRHPQAQLYQYSNDHSLAGTNVDFDKALKPDYGQWSVG